MCCWLPAAAISAQQPTRCSLHACPYPVISLRVPEFPIPEFPIPDSRSPGLPDRAKRLSLLAPRRWEASPWAPARMLMPELASSRMTMSSPPLRLAHTSPARLERRVSFHRWPDHPTFSASWRVPSTRIHHSSRPPPAVMRDQPPADQTTTIPSSGSFEATHRSPPQAQSCRLRSSCAQPTRAESHLPVSRSTGLRRVTGTSSPTASSPTTRDSSGPPGRSARSSGGIPRQSHRRSGGGVPRHGRSAAVVRRVAPPAAHDVRWVGATRAHPMSRASREDGHRHAASSPSPHIRAVTSHASCHRSIPRAIRASGSRPRASRIRS